VTETQPRSNPFRGKYLFHVHTRATDGRLCVRDYFEYAERSGVDQIIFLEHIRKQASYDVASWVAEIQQCALTCGVRASVGFEAKLLANGTLDISEKHLALAEVIGIAEHGFPNGPECLESAFLRVINSYPSVLPNKFFVWVHPGLSLQKRGVAPHLSSVHLSMLDRAQEAGVLIEHNLRYGLVGNELLHRIAMDRLVVGVDAHSLQDLQMWRAAHNLRQGAT
jgi:histidinol phosphatase-like PHP family hydrolase